MDVVRILYATQEISSIDDLNLLAPKEPPLNHQEFVIAVGLDYCSNVIVHTSRSIGILSG